MLLHKFNITKEERTYLRELAQKYLEYANLPVMEERKKLWYAHNSLKGDRPVIVIEHGTFWEDILPPLKCESQAAREIEMSLVFSTVNHEHIDDDKVISPYFTVYWDISIQQYGIEIKREYTRDANGRSLGFRDHHPINDLQSDFSLLKPSILKVDRDRTMAWKSFVEEVLGDIMPVKVKNNSLIWHTTPSQKVVELMGLQDMMYAMVDCPDEMHALYRYLIDDIKACIRWQEEEGLLVLNNENDFTGAGSYGFTTELPTAKYKETGSAVSQDLWGNLNSQETVGVSPQMYGEFVFPYYYELAKEFGLVYYGCCEPVHDIWDEYLRKLPGLRKVSVSAWSDEDFMGNALKGSNVIYSRKPSPNFIGVGDSFDEDAFSAHITKTLNAARGCKMEFIFRDIYTLSGDTAKPGKAVKIVRNLIEKLW